MRRWVWMCSNSNLPIVMQHCVPTMGNKCLHCYCSSEPWPCRHPAPVGKTWQTDVVRLIRCSLLTLEHEYLTWSWGNSLQFTCCQPVSVIGIFILSFCLCVSSCFFLKCFMAKIVYAFLVSPIWASVQPLYLWIYCSNSTYVTEVFRWHCYLLLNIFSHTVSSMSIKELKNLQTLKVETLQKKLKNFGCSGTDMCYAWAMVGFLWER